MTSESSASFKRMFERELLSCDHSSSLRGILKQCITSLMWCSWVGTNHILWKQQMVSTRTKGFLNQRLVQVTEPLITVIVLKQAFKILNSKINFLNISCQSL